MRLKTVQMGHVAWFLTLAHNFVVVLQFQTCCEGTRFFKRFNTCISVYSHCEYEARKSDHNKFSPNLRPCSSHRHILIYKLDSQLII